MIRLTRFQRDELRHKIEVMRDGFDDNGNAEPGYMASHYRFARIEELEAMDAKVAAGAIIEFDDREAKAAIGELGNAYDIATDNIDLPGDEYARAARKLLDGINRIKGNGNG